MNDRKFTELEFLEWARTKPQDETFDCIDNYSSPIAQFILATNRAEVPYVLTEEFYDEAIPVKRGKRPVMTPVPTKCTVASNVLHPHNRFEVLVLRLELILNKRNVNDFYFELRDRNNK